MGTSPRDRPATVPSPEQRSHFDAAIAGFGCICCQLVSYLLVRGVDDPESGHEVVALDTRGPFAL